MSPQEIIHHALAAIYTQTNIVGQWNDCATKIGIDGELNLEIENKKVSLFTMIKSEVRTLHLAKIEELANTHSPFILVAQKISTKNRETLRNRNIWYVEANGNIYLKNKELFLWIETNNPMEIKSKTTNRAFTKTGLKVVFQFLIHNELLNCTYRKIAEETNTGIGNVNNIFAGLKQDGYLLQLNKTHYKLDHKKRLLEKWILEYEKRLKPTLAMGTFRFLKEADFDNWKKIALKNGKTCWGGEPAGDLLTNYLRPEVLTLYTTETRSDLILNYRLVPDINGKIKVFKKFWTHEEVNHTVVPPILAYADLINEGDRRCTETAQKIYDDYLQDQF